MATLIKTSKAFLDSFVELISTFIDAVKPAAKDANENGSNEHKTACYGFEQIAKYLAVCALFCCAPGLYLFDDLGSLQEREEGAYVWHSRDDTQRNGRSLKGF